MCRSGQQPDGPKTCATDSRNDFAETQHQRTALIEEHDSVTRQIRPSEPSAIDPSHDEKTAILQRIGIAASTDASVTDYPIIAERSGDLRAWGFVDVDGDTIATSDIDHASQADDPFIRSLTDEQRTALTTYTTGMYESVNAVYTGRDPNPTDRVRATVDRLDEVFDVHATRNRNGDPVNIVRGTGIPHDWPGGVDDYLSTVFTPGSQIDTGKITSLSTNANVAANWTKRPPLIMVVQTRHGLSVRSFSDHRAEDEIIVAPHSPLRCVRVDRNGIGGNPTVYLVDECIAADAQRGAPITPIPPKPAPNIALPPQPPVIPPPPPATSPQSEPVTGAQWKSAGGPIPPIPL